MVTKKKTADALIEHLVIKAPDFRRAAFKIRGDAPLVLCRFGYTSMQDMRDKQAEGPTPGKKKVHKAKDFDALYEQALYRLPDGTFGFNATAIRRGLVESCRLDGFKMTLAKMSVFADADGYDTVDGTPLIRITHGEPHKCEHIVTIPSSKKPDIRVRAMWNPGWEATVRVKWDNDQFKLKDMAHLMMRMGYQNGIGNGRPNSTASVGCGWGTFELVDEEIHEMKQVSNG